MNAHVVSRSATVAARAPSPWMQSSIEPTRIDPSKEMKFATFMDATRAQRRKGRTQRALRMIGGAIKWKERMLDT